jgi:hypothetical protein
MPYSATRRCAERGRQPKSALGAPNPSGSFLCRRHDPSAFPEYGISHDQIAPAIRELEAFSAKFPVAVGPFGQTVAGHITTAKNADAGVVTVRVGKPRHVVLTDEGQRLFTILTEQARQRSDLHAPRRRRVAQIAPNATDAGSLRPGEDQASLLASAQRNHRVVHSSDALFGNSPVR